MAKGIEMNKTAEEILRECTGHAHGLMDAGTIRAMKAYAMQECEKVRRQCADNAVIEVTDFITHVSKQSILSTPIELT